MRARMTDNEKAQFFTNMRIEAFERYEGSAPNKEGVPSCCQQPGALKSSHGDRVGNSVTYHCRTCRRKHTRMFCEPMTMRM